MQRCVHNCEDKHALNRLAKLQIMKQYIMHQLDMHRLLHVPTCLNQPYPETFWQHVQIQPPEACRDL